MPNTTADADLVIAGRTADSILHQLPLWLDRPLLGNSETVPWWAAINPGLHDYHTVEIGDIPYAVDESHYTVVVHTSSSGHTDRETFELEVLWTLQMTSDGQRIETLWGFADSAAVAVKF